MTPEQLTPEKKARIEEGRDRGEVLRAFAEACPRPDPRMVIEWTRTYPEFADELVDYALDILEAADLVADGPLEPTAGELDAAWRRHLANVAASKKREGRRPRQRGRGR